MTDNDERPPVWVGHIALPTDQLDASEAFMLAIGMRSVYKGEKMAILELRAGTHLALVAGDKIEPGPAPFDLMVDDLDATHKRLSDSGLKPSAISEGRIHNSFTLREPAGNTIKVNSSHASGLPV